MAFNRRFVMRDGSVQTWMNYDNPNVVRAAGPIDPQIGLVTIRDENGEPRAILSNFALHLDTVGGMKWSADYPFFIDRDASQGRRPERRFDFRDRLLRRHQSRQPARRKSGTSRTSSATRSASRSQRQLGKLAPLEAARSGREVARRAVAAARRDEGGGRPFD